MCLIFGPDVNCSLKPSIMTRHVISCDFILAIVKNRLKAKKALANRWWFHVHFAPDEPTFDRIVIAGVWIPCWWLWAVCFLLIKWQALVFADGKQADAHIRASRHMEQLTSVTRYHDLSRSSYVCASSCLTACHRLHRSEAGLTDVLLTDWVEASF